MHNLKSERAFSFLVVLVLSSAISTAQEYFSRAGISETGSSGNHSFDFNIGIGAGLGYGGLGARINVLPDDNLKLFTTVGYNLFNTVMNGGIEYRILPKSNFCPYIGAMYGYNASIILEKTELYNYPYYGPSSNFGIEIWRRSRGFLNIEFLIPLRSSKYHQTMRNLKKNPFIEDLSHSAAISFGVGYHFSLSY
jgi:hypothetical protein